MTSRDWLSRHGLDTNDRFFFGGLVLAAIGGSCFSVPATLIVLGLVFAFIGLRGGT